MRHPPRQVTMRRSPLLRPCCVRDERPVIRRSRAVRAPTLWRRLRQDDHDRQAGSPRRAPVGMTVAAIHGVLAGYRIAINIEPPRPRGLARPRGLEPSVGTRRGMLPHFSVCSRLPTSRRSMTNRVGRPSYCQMEQTITCLARDNAAGWRRPRGPPPDDPGVSEQLSGRVLFTRAGGVAAQ
jgi:hypothetical protein